MIELDPETNSNGSVSDEEVFDPPKLSAACEAMSTLQKFMICNDRLCDENTKEVFQKFEKKLNNEFILEKCSKQTNITDYFMKQSQEP